MVDLKAFIKNYEKNGKITQMLTICVEGEKGKMYKSYFINVSKTKGTAYLSETKEK